jgi:hypothetical protein
MLTSLLPFISQLEELEKSLAKVLGLGEIEPLWPIPSSLDQPQPILSQQILLCSPRALWSAPGPPSKASTEEERLGSGGLLQTQVLAQLVPERSAFSASPRFLWGP